MPPRDFQANEISPVAEETAVNEWWTCNESYCQLHCHDLGVHH